MISLLNIFTKLLFVTTADSGGRRAASDEGGDFSSSWFQFVLLRKGEKLLLNKVIH